MNSFSIQEIPKSIISIVIVFLTGAVGSVYTPKEITTRYVSLTKPAENHQTRLFDQYRARYMF